MTTEQRKFIDAYLETRSPRKAMLLLYPEMDPKEAGEVGARYLRNERVKDEINLAEEASRVVSTLTAMERREWIADLVRVDVRKAHTLKPHVIQSYKATRRILETGEVEETLTVKLPDKLRAIEVDAKLDSMAVSSDDETGLLLDGLAELMGVTVALAPSIEQADALLDDAVDIDDAV